MAKTVALDYLFTLNGVDLTDCVKSIEWPEECAELDSTTFANDGGHDYEAGLVDSTVTVQFVRDYAASKDYATVAAAFGTKVTLTATPHDASLSATNPKFTATVLVSKKLNIGGNVGALQEPSLAWKVCGRTDLVTS